LKIDNDSDFVTPAQWAAVLELDPWPPSNYTF